MSKIENEVWLEEAMQNLEEACEAKDWTTARMICVDVESKGFEGYSFRRTMNLAMAGKKTPMDILSAQMDVITNGLRV